MFQIKFVEKTKTHILCSVKVFAKIVPFMRDSKNVVKPAAADNMARARSLLDK
jgi:hypothetical protein